MQTMYLQNQNIQTFNQLINFVMNLNKLFIDTVIKNKTK